MMQLRMIRIKVIWFPLIRKYIAYLIANGDKITSWQIALMTVDVILLFIFTIAYPFKIVKVCQ